MEQGAGNRRPSRRLTRQIEAGREGLRRRLARGISAVRHKAMPIDDAALRPDRARNLLVLIAMSSWRMGLGRLVASILVLASASASAQTSGILREVYSNIGDNYGQRMRALLIPPATGQYVFWIASDDNSILYLSSDEDPAHKVPIA